MNSKFDKVASELAGTILNQLNDRVDELVNEKIINLLEEKIESLDINDVIKRNIIGLLNPRHPSYPFDKENGIPGQAIDSSTLTISGSNITSGIIPKFSSTGIDDQATRCQVTILDQGTVFENTVYSPGLHIKGDAIIDGNLLVKGAIPRNSQTYLNLISDAAESVRGSIGPELLDQHQDHLLKKLQTEGISLGKISIGEQVVLDGNRLTNAVLHSQLRSVGQLQDLQTQGETLLSETLYTGKKRVGINTMEPSAALSIWDEEVELGIGKRKENVAYIGTSRPQTLTLGSNNQTNVTLETDGTTVVPKLRIGNITFGASGTPPDYDAPLGTVMFNENPSLGGPLGWVSLGGARWANFGIID